MIFKFSEEDISQAEALSIKETSDKCYNYVTSGSLKSVLSMGDEEDWAGWVEARRRILKEKGFRDPKEVDRYITLATKDEDNKKAYDDCKSNYDREIQNYSDYIKTLGKDLLVSKNYIDSIEKINMDSQKANNMKTSYFRYTVISLAKGKKNSFSSQAKTSDSYSDKSIEVIKKVSSLTSNELIKNLLILKFYSDHIIGSFYSMLGSFDFSYGDKNISREKSGTDIFGGKSGLIGITISPKKPKSTELSKKFIISITITKKAYQGSFSKAIESTPIKNMRAGADYNIPSDIQSDLAEFINKNSNDGGQRISSWISAQTGVVFNSNAARIANSYTINITFNQCPPESFILYDGTRESKYSISSGADDFVTSKIYRCNEIIKSAIGESPLYVCTHKGSKYYYTPSQLVLNDGKIKGKGGWFKPKGGKPASLSRLLNKKKKTKKRKKRK